MKSPKTLILDSMTASGLGVELYSLLESSAAPDIQIRQHALDLSERSFDDKSISEILLNFRPDVIFLLLSTASLKQAGVLFSLFKRLTRDVPVLLVVEACEPDAIFALLNLGASDFITPPLKAANIFPRMWRAVEQSRQEVTLAQTLREKLGLKQLIGASDAFQVEIKKIPLVAKCDVNVLITGETGTGKELCARAIHYLSQRADKPFVPVNCGAIPVELVENELFGHARGAFTGAVSSEQGLIHEADGGTIFFDEIDCLPLLAQVKLLRFLQEKEYRPLGSTRTHKANVHVLAATNCDLEQAVAQGRLRQDLYYRLNIIKLNLPPLRKRREDIRPLARHFLSKYAVDFDKEVEDFSDEAMRALMLYQWPGNVRELEHVVERAVALSEHPIIRGGDILLPRRDGDTDADDERESFQTQKNRMIAQFEKDYIRDLLLACHGNITRAAQMAQKNRRAFWQLIHKHRIDAQAFKQNPSQLSSGS